MIAHVVALYGISAAALLATAMSFGSGPRSWWRLWPFVALGCLEALSLNLHGHLVFQWLVPLATMAVVLGCSRSDRVVRWCYRGLLAVALVTTFHGRYVMGRDYTTRPRLPYHAVAAEWHTPLTRLARIVR